MQATTLLCALLTGPSVPGGEAWAQSGTPPSGHAASSRAGERVSIDGIAEFHQGDTLVVSGYRIRSTPATEFAGAKALSAVTLGVAVKARGVVQADGTIAASELQVRPRERANAGRGVVSGALQQEGRWLAGGGSIFRAALEANSPETRVPKVDPQYQRVSDILTRMAPGSLQESLRLHIVSSPDWNARGLPNGSIAVAAGLLTDMDDDEVAVVLGHELAHVTHQHAQKTLADAERRRLVAQLIADIVPQGGWAAGLALTVGGAVALKAWQSGYSRSVEEEADRVGLSYAAAGGFDIRKAPRVWDRFREKYGNEQALKNFVIGNHPRNTERAKNARAELSAHYPNYQPVEPVATVLTAPGLPAARDAGDRAVAAPGGNALVSGLAPPLPDPTPAVEITQGMSVDEVRALLGPPKEEIVFTMTDGRQTKWIYASLKVTFVNGRVATVEF